MSTIIAGPTGMSLRCCHLILSLLLAGTAILPGQALTVSSRRTAPQPQSLPARVVRESTSLLGVPYVHAGDSRAGMDCSGFVYRVFLDTLGARLPRGVGALYRAAEPVRMPPHIGDLLFFDTTETTPAAIPTHVGVYIGQGRVVHAASQGPKSGVIVSAVSDPYYRERFIGARRVLPWREPLLDLTVTDVMSSATELEPFPSRAQVKIRVHNGMSGGGPVNLTLSRDGRQVLSRWVTAGARKPAELSFTADIGQWSLRITRIYNGRTLSDLAFSVVE